MPALESALPAYEKWGQNWDTIFLLICFIEHRQHRFNRKCNFCQILFWIFRNVMPMADCAMVCYSDNPYVKCTDASCFFLASHLAWSVWGGGGRGWEMIENPFHEKLGYFSNPFFSHYSKLCFRRSPWYKHVRLWVCGMAAFFSLYINKCYLSQFWEWLLGL